MLLACCETHEKVGCGGVIINTTWDLALYGMHGRNPEMFAAVKAGIAGFTTALQDPAQPKCGSMMWRLAG